ncbi:GrpB family protein [Pseudomonas costantinii]|uniref:GrpB family protein n=1 Tax=Pseudomonas costantinii TaxID=168469 RepID=UPI0015A4730D|nr:GrpB family protein [Pseudomonas costantinii]NVZ69626.1 GrpB family protein [Pseudomonas costantinii]
MIKPLNVNLLPYDLQWQELAETEKNRLISALGDSVIRAHHIGSTAIPGTLAKPIIDLLLEIADLRAFENHRQSLETLGYTWLGENGLSGRRFCIFNDPITGRRLIHLHAYIGGSPDVSRHLAFRDLMLQEPALVREYEQLKLDCQKRHSDNSEAYSICKSSWIKALETRALASLGLGSQHPVLTSG